MSKSTLFKAIMALFNDSLLQVSLAKEYSCQFCFGFPVFNFSFFWNVSGLRNLRSESTVGEEELAGPKFS